MRKTAPLRWIASYYEIRHPQVKPAVPSIDFGPMDFFHGRQLRISFACRSRRSGVQPFAMLGLQEFVRLAFSFTCV